MQATVRTRRRHLARQAAGRVLDLGGAAAHRALWGPRGDVTLLDGIDDPRLARLVDEGTGFDSVLSVFQLAAVGDLPAALAAIGNLLGDDGRLLFLEPGRRTGLAGRTQQVLAPALAATAGWRLDRDVPMALRAAGLAVVQLERHRSPTTQWWLRSLVEGRARRALVAPRR